MLLVMVQKYYLLRLMLEQQFEAANTGSSAALNVTASDFPVVQNLATNANLRQGAVTIEGIAANVTIVEDLGGDASLILFDNTQLCITGYGWWFCYDWEIPTGTPRLQRHNDNGFPFSRWRWTAAWKLFNVSKFRHKGILVFRLYI